MEYRICADSSADVISLNKVPFGLASLTIRTKDIPNNSKSILINLFISLFLPFYKNII